MDNIHPEHKELCCILIVEALRKLQRDLWRTKAGQPILPPRTVNGVGGEQFVACMGMLKDKEWIDFGASGTVFRTDLSIPPKSSNGIANDLIQKYPGFEPLTHLIQRTGNRLAEFWTGKANGARVLFEKAEGKKLTEQVYNIDNTSKAFYGLMKHFLEPIVRYYSERMLRLGSSRRPLHDEMHILELGAGTGGTATWLMPLLEKYVPQGWARYHCADISDSLVVHAMQRFYHRTNFMHFFRLHMEGPLVDVLGKQDIVIVSNALHATANTVQTLRNIRQYLRPEGGIALILEIVEKECCWTDFIYGFSDGWWQFDDSRVEALQNEEEWKQDFFFTAGFTDVKYTRGSSRDSRFQKLFLASMLPK
ncbi:Putative methyltransferase type 12, S-adenosyl-L-methionine-dependent methyltransferase superfamily [Colletotrichum destructivum]|uniref:Methyltransferase type 12, S-adenosyl-L-methionine-dependent methyltransferase superfamily n=1 Tax=Colletotrichum destructivum TaxID=34406 RepID=A0AAX4J4K0_9PEZI|nr:Putative methyltransferase type 12, S-adenosyl-L-methionine-dependent methyltransferase superfamily [Colletotrichum destructivum]